MEVQIEMSPDLLLLFCFLKCFEWLGKPACQQNLDAEEIRDHVDTMVSQVDAALEKLGRGSKL